MKFYDECLECNAISQNNIITSFQMYEVYKNWYMRLYHSPPPENITDLIMEASQKGYRKVKVVFTKIKLSDFPKSTHNSPSVKKVVGNQKTEIFDVVDEASDIIKLLKSKDVEKVSFV